MQWTLKSTLKLKRSLRNLDGPLDFLYLEKEVEQLPNPNKVPKDKFNRSTRKGPTGTSDYTRLLVDRSS